MKNSKLSYIIIPVLFLCLFTAPNKVNATCNYINTSGSGIEQEAIDNCLSQQRILDQQARDQSAANAANAQALYEVKLTYFYKLDGIEKQIDARNASDSGYGLYRLESVDCIKSMDIPSDPTTMDPNLFLLRIGNKEKCISYLNSYVKKVAPTQTVQPTKSNDQICSDKFGQNWKWMSGTTCGCKDGYTSLNGQCVSYDQSCRTSYSNTRWDGKYCSCNAGYVWNNQKTGCIITPIVPIKTNDQVCSDKFGTNSNWDGTKDSSGLLNCGCKQGFTINTVSNACIAVQPPSGPVCNGKSWSACPVGSNFFCPSSGDASCTPQQQPQVATPPSTINTVVQETPKVTPPIVKDKPPTISTPPAKKKAPTVSNSVVSTLEDVPQLANAPITQVQTKKKGVWSWFKGLFGF